MKSAVFLLSPLLLVACAETQHQKEVAADRAVNDAFEQSVAHMSPDEVGSLRQRAQQNAEAEVQAAAATCGSKVQFTNEPRFEDRKVFVVVGTTAEQLACVQKQYPFVKAHP